MISVNLPSRARRARAPGLRAALLLLLALWLHFPSAQAIELSPQELRGKRIYEEGIGSGEQSITAVIANVPGPVPGSMVPCVACHGSSGRGVADDGVSPPDIRWSTLVQAGGHRHKSGRTHPAFDEQAVARSISNGVDPADHVMDAGMPRYTMMLTDLDDLLAYMKRLEAELDPGLSAEAIRLGTMLPSRGELADMGHAVQAVMQAYFDEVNAAGGVGGRRIELVVTEHQADPTFGAWMIRDLLREQRPFALVGAYVGGIEQVVATSLDETNVPLVGALTATPGLAEASNRYMFYLLSGLEGQADVLARHAGRVMTGEKPRMVVIHPASGQFTGAAAAIQDFGRQSGWASVPVLTYEPGKFDAPFLAGELRDKGAQGVFFLGPEDDLHAFVLEADGLDWAPEIFLPGVFATQGLMEYPAGFDHRVHLAASSLPSDMDPGGAEQFRRLHEARDLDYQYLDYQVQAYAAARLLVHALELAGTDLGREQLIAALEGMSDYHTGVLPPLSFSKERRIGALGAHVLVLDLEARNFDRSAGWVSLQAK